MRLTTNISVNGCIQVPKELKAFIQDSFVITNGLDQGFLCIYPAEYFQTEVKTQLRKLNQLDPKARKISRSILGAAVEGKLNTNGEIGVPAELLGQLKLGGELVLYMFFDGTKIEVCSKKFYDKLDSGPLPDISDTSYITGL